MLYYFEHDKIIDGAVRTFVHDKSFYIFMITFKFAGDYIFLRGKN